MKKAFLIFGTALALSLGANAQNKTYVNVGTSIPTARSNKVDFTEKVSFGGLTGKTNYGVLVETNEGRFANDRRTWAVGIEAGQALPIGRNVDFLVGAEAKVDVTRKYNNFLSVEPQAGIGFNISDNLSFQALYGAQFSNKYKFGVNDIKGQVNLGLQFGF